MLKAKQEAEFYKFNSTWRGKGHRLGESPRDGAEVGNERHRDACQN